MPSADQRALLQLLLKRGKDYGEIAALLGTSEAEVRARARAILTDLGGRDPDREVSLTDYLLGQADPIGRADAVRHLQRDPEAFDEAEALIEQLQLLVPGAELPALPEPRGARPPRTERARAAAPAAPAGSPAAGGFGHGMPQPKVQVLIALLIGTVLAVVTVVLVVNDGDDELAAGTATEAQEAAGPEPVEIPLERSDNAPRDAEGTATLFQERGSVILRIRAEGLRPTRGDQVYVAWLYQDRRLALPLTAGDEVGEDGALEGFAQVLPQYLALLPQIPYLDISLEPRSPLADEEETPVYRGRSILRGNLADAGPDDLAAGEELGEGLPESPEAAPPETPADG